MVRAYTYSQRGKPSKTLRLIEDYQVPKLQDDQIRVKVKAVGLNPVDWKIMAYAPGFIGKRPAVAASDYSGTVIESTSNDFQPGDEVYGIVHSSVKIATGLGSLADEIVAPALSCAKRPEKITAEHAAGISLVGLTAVVLAQQAEEAKKRSSDQQHRVLVCGGASSVGTALVSILHHRGYYVAATCSQAKADFVCQRGADRTFDYREKDMTNKLVQFTNESGQFDTVLDCADAFDVWQACESILKPTGAYTNVGADLTQGILPLVRRMISYYFRPTWLGGVARSYKRPKEIATRDNMKTLSDLVEKGVVDPLVDSEFSFDKAVEAFERLMSNRANGKVIIRL